MCYGNCVRHHFILFYFLSVFLLTYWCAHWVCRYNGALTTLSERIFWIHNPHQQRLGIAQNINGHLNCNVLSHGKVHRQFIRKLLVCVGDTPPVGILSVLYNRKVPSPPAQPRFLSWQGREYCVHPMPIASSCYRGRSSWVAKVQIQRTRIG